jgi:hypothetical protein
MAKRCATEIQYSRGQDNRRWLYRKLIVAAHATPKTLVFLARYGGRSEFVKAITAGVSPSRSSPAKRTRLACAVRRVGRIAAVGTACGCSAKSSNVAPICPC